jgi:hypothetical protein
LCHLISLLGVTSLAFSTARAQAGAGPVDWRIDNLTRIGGHTTVAIGNPQIIAGPAGKAVLFNGSDQGLVIDVNPVAGLETFTVEAVFRPDAGGEKEQRWLHVQGDSRDDRVLLEIRVDGDQWFLDTFIKSGAERLTLYADKFKHPLGRWYQVALVFDGTKMTHYVDGREEMAGALRIAPLVTGKTSLGVRMNRMYWFKGAISRVRFTPRALTPEEFMKK